MPVEVLVTGGAGFIGSTLVDELLARGIKVVVIDNFNDYYDPYWKEQNVQHNLDNQNYKLYKGNICDKSLLCKIFSENNISRVVHLAACAGVRSSISNPLKYVESNIYGTINLLECMKSFNVKKIVFASSSSVYGNCSAEKFSEDLKVNNPISPYAATKVSCEQFLYTYSNLYNMSAICLRFFTVYGPRQRPDLAIRKFINSMLNNGKINIYGNGDTVRDYTYVDDIIAGICSALEYDTPYEVINLGGGNPISINQVVRIIETAIGKKVNKSYLPKQQGDVERTASDISKARNLLKYEPKVTFEEGIRRTIQWIEQNRKDTV